MILNAEVLSGSVQESGFYDPSGVQKFQWAIELKVTDVETDETYSVQITDGFPLLEELKQRKRNGESLEVLREVAAQLEAQLPGRHTPLQLQVLKLKGKQVAFLKLVCRLMAVGAVA